MVAITTNTFATSTQPYPSQPHLSRWTNLLIKTVFIALSHMESPTWFLQDPSSSISPHFTIEPLLSVNYFNRFWYTSSQVIFLFQRKFPFLKKPHSNPPLPLKWYMQFQCRPWCSLLNGISASIELFIKNCFLWWSPHFFAFELLNYNPPKRYMQFQWQFHTVSLFLWLTSKTKRWNFGLILHPPTLNKTRNL